MNRTNCVETHAPSHLREQFLGWLDSHEPNRLREIDIRPVASLLDSLSTCGDVLPADYCDQLEIAKGSTYAQAVEEVRRLCARKKKTYQVTYILWAGAKLVEAENEEEAAEIVEEMDREELYEGAEIDQIVQDVEEVVER